MWSTRVPGGVGALFCTVVYYLELVLLLYLVVGGNERAPEVEDLLVLAVLPIALFTMFLGARGWARVGGIAELKVVLYLTLPPALFVLLWPLFGTFLGVVVGVPPAVVSLWRANRPPKAPGGPEGWRFARLLAMLGWAGVVFSYLYWVLILAFMLVWTRGHLA